MNRRQFGAAIAALGLVRQGNAEHPPELETFPLSRNGWVPNNERLPVLLYRHAFKGGDVADQMESTFGRNVLPAQWRNGIYTFHHYHSTAHEVLGIAAGEAHVVLGGEGGHDVLISAGDVLVLPTGTGHFLAKAEPGFLVIGAYPAGQHWDVCRAAPDLEATERMRHLPFPAMDPITGGDGELIRRWPLA